MKAQKLGGILILLGLVIVIISTYTENRQVNEEYNRRWDYIQKKYPPGTYRGPEVAEYLMGSYSQPSSGGSSLGIIVAIVGFLMLFIKGVQEMK